MKSFLNKFFHKHDFMFESPEYAKEQLLAFLKEDYKKNGHPIEAFNIVGVRNSQDIRKDVINDFLIYWTEDDVFVTRGTTESGVAYFLNKHIRNKKGTFTLNYGFHEKIWCIGIHKGYEAFVNDWEYCKPTKGWRDVNYNFVKDPTDIEVCDYFGINCHRAHPFKLLDKIGRYSAGCQVVRSNKDFQKFLVAFKSTSIYKNNKYATVNYKLYSYKEFPLQLISV